MKKRLYILLLLPLFFVSSCKEDIEGCTNEEACNFNINATNTDDDSCEYPAIGYDCAGIFTAQIGDVIEGGYLFYLDETGEHGLVAALEDLTEGASDPYDLGYGGYEWGCFDSSVAGAAGVKIGTGYQNTLGIVAQNCQTESGGVTAAQAALNYTSNGYIDWYLPSIDELLEMYNTLENGGLQSSIGGFETNDGPRYLSSTEVTSSNVCYVYFANGNPTNNYKNHSYRVRAIRAF